MKVITTDPELISIDHSEGELPVDGLLDAMGRGEKKEERLTIDDYEEVLKDHRQLVRELDILLNGKSAAKQASLCDIVAQLSNDRRFTLAEALEIWDASLNYYASEYKMELDFSKNQMKPQPNREQYFKEKFNIDLNK